MTLNPISPSGFLKSENGQVYYAYSGIQTGTGTSTTLMTIPNVGLDGLLVDMTTTADWTQVVASLGFSVEIDGGQIFYHVNDTSAGIDVQAPWYFRFYCAPQTELKVISYTDGASLGASRSAMLIASPLRMVA